MSLEEIADSAENFLSLGLASIIMGIEKAVMICCSQIQVVRRVFSVLFIYLMSSEFPLSSIDATIPPCKYGCMGQQVKLTPAKFAAF